MKSIYLKKYWQQYRKVLNTHVGVWLGLAFSALVVVWQQIEVRSARALVNQTFEVVDSIQNQQALVLRSQSNLLKYLLWNDPSALNYYKSQQQSILSQLATLKELTADNPIQQNNLEKLQTIIEQHFQQQENLIEKQQTSNKKSNLDLLNEDRSVLDLDILKEQLAKIEAVEKDLLLNRRLELNRRAKTMTITVLSSLLLASLLYWLTSKERERQKDKERVLNKRLELIEIEQDLSNHLLTCRTKEEAQEILRSFFQYFLPESSGAIFEINNSRDQLQPTVIIRQFPEVDPCNPKECWALRKGQMLTGKRKAFAIPCQLCKNIYSEDPPQGMLCLPLQAHEQTIGILHLTDTKLVEPDSIINLAPQVALPLAVLHLQANLEYQTFKDSNTGLWNRRFMDVSIQRLFARAKRLGFNSENQYPVGVIFCDVDHFKIYNTEFGHDAGDIVLRDSCQVFNGELSGR